MATTTYEPIISYTVPSAVSSVTLGSGGQGTIPSTYTDLVLVVQPLKSTAGGGTLRYQVNGDTGTNYSNTTLFAEAGTVYSDRASNASYGRIGFWNGDSVGNTLITNFQNYSNTSTFKTSISRAGNASAIVGTVVNLWRSTAAITSILIYNDGGNFAAGSTFTLYGIANADSGAKATGGVITYDSTYYYHTFGASGTFTPKQSLTADILVVAGGGGGGGAGASGTDGAGGGGAGGLLGFASQSLSATGYTVTVGSGGAGVTNSSARGATGGDSQFGALTLVKGGGGGGSDGTTTGATGGSGGGAGFNGIGGSATSGQGNAGGSTSNNTPGGGGGAGAAGSAGVTASDGGNGGNGLSTYSSWGLVAGVGENVSGTVYFAGGGGGASDASAGVAGTGGLGGGGLGMYRGASPAASGLVNTGGGGGGAGAGNKTSGNGGSGVVIIRYLKA